MFGDAVLSAQGGWRLFRRDPDGFRYFSLTQKNFWLSFVTILPVILLGEFLFLTLDLFVGRSGEEIGTPVINLIFDGAIAMALFALTMVPLSEKLGRPEGYVSFIIAWHWTGLVVSLIFQALIFLYAVMSALDVEILKFALFLTLLGFFAYQAMVGVFIARQTLHVEPLIGFSIVAIAFGIAIVTTMVLHEIMGVVTSTIHNRPL
ncbi:MAG: hypothetical protein AAGA88_02300 [Pseudomonadota bacterium]